MRIFFADAIFYFQVIFISTRNASTRAPTQQIPEGKPVALTAPRKRPVYRSHLQVALVLRFGIIYTSTFFLSISPFVSPSFVTDAFYPGTLLYTQNKLFKEEKLVSTETDLGSTKVYYFDVQVCGTRVACIYKTCYRSHFSAVLRYVRTQNVHMATRPITPPSNQHWGIIHIGFIVLPVQPLLRV